MWSLFLGTDPLRILEVLGGESFRALEWDLGSAPEAGNVKWSIAAGDKKANAFIVPVTCLDTVGLRA